MTPEAQPNLKMTIPIGTVLETVQEQLVQILSTYGRDKSQTDQAMSAFIAGLQPDIQAAMAIGDTRSLSYLKDAIAAHMGRVTLDFTFREQQNIQNTIMVVVGVLLKVAIIAAVGG